MNTGENITGLRKIIDFIRLVSIAVLVIHVYFFCYEAFETWGYTFKITDRIIQSIANTGLFDSLIKSQLIAMGLLAVSLIGAKGRKDEKINAKTAVLYILIGLLETARVLATRLRNDRRDSVPPAVDPG